MLKPRFRRSWALIWLALGFSQAHAGDVHSCIDANGTNENAAFILNTIQGVPILETEMVELPQTTYTEFVPAEFEWVVETTISSHPATSLEIIPPKFGWVDGEHPGASLKIYVIAPAFTEWREATVIVRPEETRHIQSLPGYTSHNGKSYMTKLPEWVELTVPPIYEKTRKQVVVKPQQVKKQYVNNVIKDGRTYMVTVPAQTREGIKPVNPEAVMRRVVKTPARKVERVLEEPLYEKRDVQVGQTPNKYTLENRSGELLYSFDTFLDLQQFKRDLSCEDMKAFFGE